MTHYIFITGGVLSSLGKGIAAASLGALLESRGYTVRLRKLDPYINLDPGTMSPYQHGEVFVTNDGAETDLDLGHYERFTGVESTKEDSTTAGRIYNTVITKERRGDYLGATVQVIPHITDAIKAFIGNDSQGTDFLIIEVGGTVGDIEGLPFIEAIRQFGNDVGRAKCLYIHLTLVPFVASSQELKTKPSQHSVKELLSLGIQPDILLCRTEKKMSEETKEKLALFCNVPKVRVIEALDVKSIYEVPLYLHTHQLDTEVCRYFHLTEREADLEKWETLVHTLYHPQHTVKIGLAAKYAELPDAYKSVLEALTHGGIAHKTKVQLEWIDVEALEKEEDTSSLLNHLDGLLVPGGFGSRGTLGKIKAITFARETKKPCFGICLGMQLMIVEYARSVLGLHDASSTEFGSTAHPVVGLLTEWQSAHGTQTRTKESDLGGSMRLGAYPCFLKEKTLVREIYGASKIEERHRHRYEVNTHYKKAFEEKGLLFSGLSPKEELPEIVEIPSHPWFVGVQFHPEFKSRPFAPHPLFKAFIGAALKERKNHDNQTR